MSHFKAGFGAPAAMAKLGTDRPLIAEITEATLLQDGATVDLTGWTAPALELEVAVHTGKGLSIAIELADVNFPPEDPQTIVETGIFHRAWILSPPVADATLGRGLLRCNGELVASADDVAALTGGHAYVTGVVEDTIGRPLADGEVVITGSVVPPQPCAGGQRWEVEIEGLGALAVTLSVR